MARALRRSLWTLLFAFPTIAFAQTPAGLAHLLAAEASRLQGALGVNVKHLSTGEEAGIRADDSFNSAR